MSGKKLSDLTASELQRAAAKARLKAKRLRRSYEKAKVDADRITDAERTRRREDNVRYGKPGELVAYQGRICRVKFVTSVAIYAEVLDRDTGATTLPHFILRQHDYIEKLADWQIPDWETRA